MFAVFFITELATFKLFFLRVLQRFDDLQQFGNGLGLALVFFL
jgi:hypothetical protein